MLFYPRLHGICNFNPRAHEGHDAINWSIEAGLTIFQSTCPRGARPANSPIRCRQPYFNPRAHEGHDHREPADAGDLHYFNPRAHEGHDIWHGDPKFIDPISIHVPTRGTTRQRRTPQSQSGFQSTCPRGARLTSLCSGPTTPDFNPRAHEGHDLIIL